MKDIIQMLTQPISHDFLGWGLLCLLWLLLLLIVGLVSMGMLALIDYAWLPLLDGSGTVTEMNFEAAHYSVVYNAALKMPQQIYHANAWCITIKIDNDEDDFYLSSQDYMRQNIGKKLNCQYKIGRIFHGLHIKTIQP